MEAGTSQKADDRQVSHVHAADELPIPKCFKRHVPFLTKVTNEEGKVLAVQCKTCGAYAAVDPISKRRKRCTECGFFEHSPKCPLRPVQP